MTHPDFRSHPNDNPSTASRSATLYSRSRLPDDLFYMDATRPELDGAIRQINLQAIERELQQIEREYRMSFAIVGTLGLLMFTSLLVYAF